MYQILALHQNATP